MLKQGMWRTVGAVVATAALVLGSAATAHANPTPNNGPEAGGTTVTVPGPEFLFTSVSAGWAHSIATGANGKFYAWGSNAYGELGDGTNTGRHTLGEVVPPAGVTFMSVSAGGAHSWATGSDGKTYTWGNNDSKELGDGSWYNRNTPVEVLVPAGVTLTSLSMGNYHSLATGSDGKTYAWGMNYLGQLGTGTGPELESSPLVVAVPAGVTFTSVSAGDTHSLATGSDGRTYAWGWNEFGELGDGTTTPRNTPVEVAVPAGVTFTSVSAGRYYSVATGSDGKVYAWGSNDKGQLGDGTTTDRLTPVAVAMPAGVTFTSVSTGESHSVAIGSDGKVYAWGSNEKGQLGDGTTTDRLAPVEIETPAGVTFTSVSADSNHSVALASDGKVYAWGWNELGQLGDGTTTDRYTPTEILLDIIVTGVTFDGIAGTNVVNNGDGTWSVDTPPHVAATVDVVVSWTLNGVVRSPTTYPGGFTYNPTPAVLPTVTDPKDQTVTAGDTATFSVTTTGDPTVTWQVSRDGGTTWEAISADPNATPSADGLTLSVVGSDANNGFLYRATATNSAGAATSQAAKLTVVKAPVEAPAGNNSGGKQASNGLAVTGSEGTPVILISAIAALLLGAGLLTANRVARRRVNR